MISFESFDYDIIVLIIIFFSCIFGAYYGVKRELKHLVNFLLPLVILHFMLKKIFDIINEKTKIIVFLENFIESIFGLKNSKLSLITLLSFGIICYIILFLFLMLIFRIFKKKNEKLLLAKESKRSRLIGSILGIIEGYVISFITLCLVSNVFVINYNKPITSFISTTSKMVSKLSEYDYCENACESFEKLDYQFSIVFGLRANEIYKEFINEQDYIETDKTKDEILKDYCNYLYENDKDENQIKMELSYYFKYKEILINELNFLDCDLDEYSSEIEKIIKNNPNDVLLILRTFVEENDFYEMNYLLEKTKNNKIILGYSENIFKELAYQVILVTYSDIHSIINLSENNEFIKCYLKDIEGTNKNMLIEYKN